MPVSRTAKRIGGALLAVALAVTMAICATHVGHAQVLVLPPVRVSGRLGANGQPRLVAIVVENMSTAAVSLRAVVVLQRREHSMWVAVRAAGLLLRSECGGTPLPSCVTLAPHTTVVTAPWLGTVGDAQCVCTRCAEAAAGEYCFVALTCDARAIEGAPFTLPAPPLR